MEARETTQSIVDGFNAAWTSGDFAAARGYLADDLDYAGTLLPYASPENFVELLSAFFEMQREVVYLSRVYHDDRAALLFDFVTDTPAGTIRVGSFYRVGGGKIRELRLVLDPTRVRDVMTLRLTPPR
jgi:hypothetical protein